MFGEDASGRKVSLLNDSVNTSTSTSTITNTTNTSSIARFARPTLPHRPRDVSSVSSASQPSRKHSNKSSSSRSSDSCSPRHSPPTPPLARLDSRSSIQTANTPSPMTPPYNFDPLDHPDFNKNQQGSLPYYTNSGYQPHHGGDEGNPYSSMPIQNQQAYYTGMNAQQPLPPMFTGLNPAYSPQPNVQLQPAPLPPYPANHMNPLAPPHISQGLAPIPLPSSQPQYTIPNSTIDPANTTPHTSSAVSPIKSNHTTTAADSNATITAPTNISSHQAGSSSGPGTPTSSLPSKKKYPCPHAKEYKCIDTFTTSGHAARHGKKHTGEKNVNCPTCGKAFTRKDNMKQHERTHKAGHSARGANSIDSPNGAGGMGANKARKRTMSGSTMGSLASPSSATAGAVEDDEDADGDVDMDIGQGHTRTGTINIAAAVHAKKERPPMGKSKLSEIIEQVTTGRADVAMDADGEADGEGESPTLDALATVAGAMGARLNR